jgi:hypothetical protein
MKAMRCYFLKNGVIRAVEVVRCVSNDAAIEEALRLFEKSKYEFAEIEVWDGNRRVFHYPADVRRSA